MLQPPDPARRQSHSLWVTSRVTARLCACRATPRHDKFADSWFKTSDLSYFDEEVAAAGTDTETERAACRFQKIHYASCLSTKLNNCATYLGRWIFLSVEAFSR